MKHSLLLLLILPCLASAQTLEECQQAAEHNYPLIHQLGLIEQTTGLTMANIRKGWLPQIQASAQATLQSDVTSFPESMQALYRQAGIDMKGLRKDQYRVGIDIQQTIYDGGANTSQQEVARQQGRVQAAQTESIIYKVRARVNELFFGLLLTDEQLRLNLDLQKQLETNEQQLSTMFRHGTAAESDLLTVKAERLKVMQQATNLQAQRRTLARLLSTFCGTEVTRPTKPALPTGHQQSQPHPELRTLDAQIQLTEAQDKALDAALRPRLALFASGFYGYPGYNLFEDMMHRRWSVNAMVGARLQWNIGALYTRRNDKARLRLQRQQTENNRQVFLFNNQLEQIQEDEDTERYRQLMKDDAAIIDLRTSVRKAAESKLAHGIIDVNDLVREINNENAARVEQSVHELEMLKALYNKKYTTNE